MTPKWIAVTSIFLIGIMLILVLRAITELEGREKWYEEGWRDCESYHNHFGMTSDDKEVLKQLKLAIRAYIKSKGYWRSGDYKKLDRAENFDELKHLVWDICVARRAK